MSDKIARTHTHTSNRAKAKDPAERKVVFKSVIDNPFRIRWPSVPVNVQNLVLAQLSLMLEGLSEYHRIHGEANRKRKRALKQGAARKKSRLEPTDSEAVSLPTETPAETEEASVEESPMVPSIFSHLVMGINEVTKRLEGQVQSCRERIKATDAEPEPLLVRPCSLKTVFVCRADVDPPILIDHLPQLVAAVNSTGTAETVILVPLPKGAESTLSELLGIRRIATFGLDSDTPGLPALLSLVESLPLLSAQWLSTLPQTEFIPTHIKQLKTSAPKDMKAAKEQKKAAKAESKASAKEKQKVKPKPVVVASAT
ncbi:hypothetical protein C8J56DRAFT_772768 [Mycena floridula]|nr:hypothetical protein C8J56DRAFT_772768 [Mycena floridula]